MSTTSRNYSTVGKTPEEILQNIAKEEERKKKRELRRQQKIKDLNFLKTEPFYFYYEKLDNRPNPRDFLLKLKNIYCAKFNGTRLGQIPDDIELSISIFKSRPEFVYKYKVIFENKIDFTEIEFNRKNFDDTIVFDKDRFKWLLEEVEHGIIE